MILVVILVEGLLALFAFIAVVPKDIKTTKTWKRLESHYAFLSVFLIIIYMAYCVSQII